MRQLLDYVDKRILPEASMAANRVVSQGHKGYYVVDGILYHEDAIVTLLNQASSQRYSCPQLGLLQ